MIVACVSVARSLRVLRRVGGALTSLLARSRGRAGVYESQLSPVRRLVIFPPDALEAA